MMGDKDSSTVCKERTAEEFFEQGPSGMAVLDGL